MGTVSILTDKHNQINNENLNIFDFFKINVRLY